MLNQEVEGLKTAEGLKFVRSTDTGTYDEEAGAFRKIISRSRTSHTAWCTEACRKDKMVQSIQKKISEVVNIPVSNWEALQVLQVEFAVEALLNPPTLTLTLTLSLTLTLTLTFSPYLRLRLRS